MKQKTKKILILSFLALLGLAACIGFYFYNKGPLDVKHSNGIPVNANELYSIYSSDSLKANKKFTSRVLLVRGEVSEVSVNSRQQKIIMIKTGAPGAYVNCTLEESTENINESDKVSIKGICSGIGQGNAELGIMGDVYLTRCFVSK
jgi:hypothetical protein